jgi:hypothetical protein
VNQPENPILAFEERVGVRRAVEQVNMSIENAQHMVSFASPLDVAEASMLPSEPSELSDWRPGASRMRYAALRR